MTHSSGVKVLIAPSRPDHAAVVSVEFLREVYSTLRGMFDYVVVDTPPGLHARGDRDHRQRDQRLHGRDARRALAEEHEARARDARPDGLPAREHQARPEPRPQPRRASPTTRWSRSWAASPTSSFPSDRDIPRAVNEGKPILIAKPQAEASVAYRQLAASYLLGEPTDRNIKGKRKLFGEEGRDGSPREALADPARRRPPRQRSSVTDPHRGAEEQRPPARDRRSRAAALQRQRGSRRRCASASSPTSAAT